MSLEPGLRLRHYEIVEAIGAGGMGHVYRARDKKLRRDVAIKVLPEEFSKDPDRLDRFEREARLLAQLNHANIATLYGLEDLESPQDERSGVQERESVGAEPRGMEGRRKFLVMELVGGETLAERIARGPMPFDEALPLFMGIAEGLEAAHDKGIIHRDLKPANVKIGPDGKPKILDFGLAKAFAAQEDGSSEASQSPTLTKAGTQLGVIMGTAAYMSPEQARGKLVDKRTDLWAFGCCLFEVLVGSKAYEGDNVTDILAAVVRAEPDWSALPSDIPLHVLNVLRRCLKKKLDERLRDAGDARLLLGDEEEPVMVPRPQISLPWAKVTASALVAAIVGGLIAWNVKREAPAEVMRLATVLPAREELGLPSRIAVSPDGSKLVYEDQEGLYLRSLSDLEPRLIPGSAGGSGPFFSPDGEWIAFFDRTNLVKVRADGDTPMRVAKPDFGSSFLFTGTWGEDDSIVISEFPSALLHVNASTGAVEEATTLDTERGEIAHYGPELLPGGRALLYTAVIMPSERRDIVGKFLDSNESRVLIEHGASPQYVRTGHIVFARDGALFAVRFDAERLEVTGEPFPIIEDVAIDVYGSFETPQFDVTDSGTLSYIVDSPDIRASSLVWVNRHGLATLVTEELGVYMIPRISPDGQKLAFARLDNDTGQRDLWVLDLERGSRTRITFGKGLSTDPEWAPDGRSLVFASNRSDGVFNIYSKAADGTGDAVQLTHHQDDVTFARSYLSDGSGFLFWHRNDVGVLRLAPEPKEEILLGTAFRELEPSLSPDGRWLAYVSDESGRREVYIQPFPRGDGRWAVSNEGGSAPAWSPNGRELFYRNGLQMMVVSISGTSELRLGTPSVLFEGAYTRDPFGNDARNYDVSPDGERFLMIRRESGRARPQRQLNIVVNWFEELKALDAHR